MQKLGIFVIMLITLHMARSLPVPQFFGQSFSSSSFTGPNGQIITNSAYEDTNGNRLVNGSPTSLVQPVKAAVQPVAVAARPQTTAGNKNVSSGQYVHDDSGKWKGN